jgi:RHS repeat-associated protein
MTTNATTTTRTHRNGRLAAVRCAVLRSGIPPVSSYPRRRVSSTNKRWIPAFAGMTTNSYTWTVPSQITLPGGTVRTQQYDGLLRLKTLAVKDPGQSSVMNYQYGYDLTDNITTKTTEAGTTNYSYDPLDRLTAAAYTNTAQTNEAYSYDPVANRLTDSHTAAAVWSYDANNQLTQVLNGAGTISYSYDANGNTISQSDDYGSTSSPQARNYVYDTDNRLIEVRDGSNTLIAAYSYDPFGRRLSKDAGASKTYYLYNEAGLIAEADATGQVTRSYGYAPGSTLRPSSGQAYTTNPLWMKTGAAYYTYQNDHLGTPMKLLSQSGAAVWSATYDAFGKATVNPSSTVTNNLRLPGQYYDQETELHYNWMRYYDPGTGRYVTSDPIGLLGGINMYAYVGGNPLSRIDPWGLASNAASRCDCSGTTWYSRLKSASNVRYESTNKFIDQKLAEIPYIGKIKDLPVIGINPDKILALTVGLGTEKTFGGTTPLAEVIRMAQERLGTKFWLFHRGTRFDIVRVVGSKILKGAVIWGAWKGGLHIGSVLSSVINGEFKCEQ